MDNLKISISGIRGHCPEDLSWELIEKFILSFEVNLEYGPIVCAWDSRLSGVEMYPKIIEALKNSGRKVFDAGIVPLPTLQMAVKKFGCVGAVMLTASHNPAEYNGIKFLNKNGEFVSQEVLDKVINFEGDFKNGDGEVEDVNDEAVLNHIDAIRKNISISKSFKIAVDTNNAAGSQIIPRLLNELGCGVIHLATNIEEDFVHTPEPLEKNLSWTLGMLQGLTYDFCVVVDPDADRIVFINEKGEFISEEKSLALLAKNVYEKGYKDPFVVNLSTSKMSEDIAKSFDSEVIYSKVGEKNVVEKMKENGSLYGGEGGGGIIDGRIHYGRDSLVGLLHVLELLDRGGKKMSEIVEDLPEYYMIKHNIKLDSNDQIPLVYAKVRESFKEGKIDTKDGIRVDFEDSWVHLRPSNTEPIFRIYLEAKTKEKAENLLETIKTLIK